jgi:hypothetical protein
MMNMWMFAGEDALACAEGPVPVARKLGDVLGPARVDVVGAEDVLVAALARHGREARRKVFLAHARPQRQGGRQTEGARDEQA